MLFAQVNDVVEKVKSDSNLVIYAAAAVGGLVVLFVLFKILTGKKKHPNLEKGMNENLADYPPPPASVGPKQLQVNGVPVRIRLVVIAPAGNQKAVTPDEAPEILDSVLRGLGGLLKSDKPRVKIWPAQLSLPGFAPTFHRLVKSPDAGKPKSEWVKLAGVAKIGGKPVLVGLALLADEPCKIGELRMEQTDWADTLQVVKTE
ncbi:hypothetical protein [Zavarzinella formosa]|uniref:hypothetical protein n=1 Tax=Zavarzinella formosa TaxID=360055 RepID=UPI0003040964|nr:hypothetical protein [Zavarzinella formosa]